MYKYYLKSENPKWLFLQDDDRCFTFQKNNSFFKICTLFLGIASYQVKVQNTKCSYVKNLMKPLEFTCSASLIISFY